jgi:putative MATE family efflux protein
MIAPRSIRPKPLVIKPNRIKRIMAIGLPIMGAMVSGVVLGLIDTAMVASLGDAALGAVGFSSFAAFIFLGFFYGFSIAVQATVSRRRGEGELLACGPSLSAALMLIAVAAPPLSAILYFAIPYLFPLINNDPEVISIGIDYIRWLIVQAAFIGFIAANQGFWNGLGLSRIYLPSLLTMHASNILFNYIFIFGNFGAPEMGAEGAGFATALSSVVGTVLFLYLGLRKGKQYGYLSKVPSREETTGVLRLAIPAGFQQVMDVAALTITYGIVGTVGTRELASYSVLINLINLVGLPAWGLGTAGATLVGQSLGEKDTDGAREWAWDVLKIGSLAMLVLGMPIWLFPDLLLSIWIYDEETRAIALWPTIILGAMMCFNGTGYMLAMMLNGAGDVKRVTWINLVTQWGILVPGAYLFGLYFGLGLIGIWCVHQFVYRAGHVLIFGYFWRRGDWSRITL